MDKKTCFILLFALLSQTVEAQYKKRINESGLYLLSGLSIIDDSFTVSNNPLGVSERWNYGFFIGVELKLMKNLSAQAVFSRNFYKEGNMVDNRPLEEHLLYEAIDLFGLYSLTEAFNLREHLEPYLILGFGSTIIDNADRFSINYGFGFRIWMRQWFSRRRSVFMQGLGFSAQTLGKSGLGETRDGRSYGGQIQHTLGVIYQF